jgi:hypothetical protein
MKYAIIKIANPISIDIDIDITSPCFVLMGEFDTLKKATSIRDNFDHPEWCIIIQVW